MKKTKTVSSVYLIKKIWDISKKRVLITFMYNLLSQTIMAYYSVIFMRYIFGGHSGIKRTFKEIALFVVISTAVMGIIQIFNSWYSKRYIPMSNIEIERNLNFNLFDKVNSLDVECFENADFYDNYTKTAEELVERSTSALNNYSALVCNVFALVFIVSNIWSIDKIAAMFTVIPLFGSLIFGKYANKLEFRLDVKNTINQRMQNYVDRVFFLKQFSKELRLTKIQNVLFSMYETAMERNIKNINDASPIIYIINIIESIFCFPLVFEGTWLYASYKAIIVRSIVIGDFIVLTSAVVNVTWIMRGILEALSECQETNNYVGYFKEFFNYRSKIDENQTGLKTVTVNKLEFCNVSFGYGTGEYVVRNLNLTFESGKITALVGENGAGKSTIIKLLLRLYDPDEGMILLNGVDIKRYDVKNYRALVSAIFQDYKLFANSIIENVLMCASWTKDEEVEVEQALKQVGLWDQIQDMPERMNSILSKEFCEDGIILSEGQNQRLAIARALVQQKPIIIFDEPSSSLDPLAEHELFDLFFSHYKNSKGIAVLISHRLSSTARADMIYMIEKGEVIEAGTHSDLMQRNGKYCSLYKLQAESYVDF